MLAAGRDFTAKKGFHREDAKDAKSSGTADH
jgi:hypothetical protein